MLAYYNQSKNEINFYEAENIESTGVFTLSNDKVNIKTSNLIQVQNINEEVDIPNVPSQLYHMIINFEGINNNIEFADKFESYKEAYNATPNKLKIVLVATEEATDNVNQTTIPIPLLSITDNLIRINYKTIHPFLNGWKYKIHLELEGSDIEVINYSIILYEFI